jgi:hypothetical protein
MPLERAIASRRLLRDDEAEEEEQEQQKQQQAGAGAGAGGACFMVFVAVLHRGKRLQPRCAALPLHARRDSVVKTTKTGSLTHFFSNI